MGAKRDVWPVLLAALSFAISWAVRWVLSDRDLIDPLTALVGGMSQALTFIATFALLFSLVAAAALRLRSKAARKMARAAGSGSQIATF